mmetsp:Transcript_33473/g.75622  ORF Transcript_33473/g.75622 Transcript_33473/m.75622 type:complete len:570 (+) Transcript_33473:141-1850(+)
MEEVDVDALDRLFGRYTPEVIRTISLLSGDDVGVAKEHLARLRRQAALPGRQGDADGNIADDRNRPVSPEELVRSLRRDVRSRMRRGSDDGDARPTAPTGSPPETTTMPREPPRESSAREQEERSGSFSDGLAPRMRPRGSLLGGPSSAFSSGPISRQASAISTRHPPGVDGDVFTARRSRRAERGALHFEAVAPPPPVSGVGSSVDSPGPRSRVLGTRRTASDPAVADRRHPPTPTRRAQSDPVAAPHYYAKPPPPRRSLADILARRQPAASAARRDSPGTIPSEVQLQMAIELSLGDQERRLSAYSARRGRGAVAAPSQREDGSRPRSLLHPQTDDAATLRGLKAQRELRSRSGSLLRPPTDDPSTLRGGLTALSAPDAFEPDADELWDLAGSAAAERMRIECDARPGPDSTSAGGPRVADVSRLSAGQSPPPRGHPAERTLRSMRLWRWCRSQARTRAREGRDAAARAAADHPEEDEVDDDDDDGTSAGGDSQATLKMSGCGVVVRAVGGADDAAAPSWSSLCDLPAGREGDARRGGRTSTSCPAKLPGPMPTAMGTLFGDSTHKN